MTAVHCTAPRIAICQFSSARPIIKCQLNYFSHSCPSVHTETTDKSNKTPNYAVHSYTNHFRIASGMMSKIKYFAHRKLFMLKFKDRGKSKNAAPQLPLTEIRYLQEKRGKMHYNQQTRLQEIIFLINVIYSTLLYLYILLALYSNFI